MRHLRSNGVDVSGSKQKCQLINTGYFHGYKGYRFFKSPNNIIPFKSYNDIYATIKYDSELKALFYPKLMFIETAAKNIALNRIMRDADSENIQNMLKRVVTGYNSFNIEIDENTKKKAQCSKLKLESNIQSAILRAYNQNNPQITHFYNNLGYNGVPLWALFEILTLGDFANLISCLNIDTRNNITLDLGMQVSAIDTNRELIYKYLYVLKDLRNAVAHNSVVFDTRFRKFDPSKAMKKCLEQEFNLPYVNFNTIGDYIVLICYYLKLLKTSKIEIRSFVRDFEKITEMYIKTVDTVISKKVIHPDLQSRINIVRKFI